MSLTISQRVAVLNVSGKVAENDGRHSAAKFQKETADALEKLAALYGDLAKVAVTVVGDSTHHEAACRALKETLIRHGQL